MIQSMGSVAWLAAQQPIQYSADADEQNKGLAQLPDVPKIRSE